MSRNTFADTITTSIKREIRKINTAIPGSIETYDNTTRKASVNIDINITLENGETLNTPIITNVPVVFPSANGMAITFPLKRGDGVLLIFCQNSLERWCNTAGEVTEPDTRKFALSDAVAIPGLFDFKSVAQGSSDGLEVKLEEKLTVNTQKNIDIDATESITVDGSSINLNNGSNEAARKEDATLSNSTTDSAYWAWLAGFVGVFSAWVPVPSDGGAALKTALTAYLGINPTPTNLTGKINAGSSTVKIGG